MMFMTVSYRVLWASVSIQQKKEENIKAKIKNKTTTRTVVAAAVLSFIFRGLFYSDEKGRAL